ncbi:MULTISPECIES: high frequency lysogenization protein HflD [unclassified Oceanobacter]|uniref:high frequency lysogenization protein HflD n=1 Tax=unclassified Oceanobacter TaxID=2620260 RepID=UPI0026E1C28B|nr:MULTISPECIES: high frequency lysogenization protein HflD [unclassified Oceanobacter]MDO6681070.1 high frequency lysogenization protein HflD [Oceanobacter sp. 5_MG-2023]MDP2504358.1 high frequency lysogenization protein HflD [Oceanobacter sp. 3_MG-2023]
MTDRRQQAIAIAAVVQAATLVEQLARTGDTSISDATPLLASLFEQNPESFDDIYGDPSHSLHLGINTLQTLASGKGDSLSPDITRYTVAILHLESKLRRNHDMIAALGNGIQQASRQVDHFSISHENTISALAELYKQTLSNLSFRIHVTGDPMHLQNEHTANKVRALLLSGIRAAILWRQVGGRRWHLLLRRKQYLNALAQLSRPGNSE